MSRQGRYPAKDPRLERHFTARDRTIERGRGCWNCTKWLGGEAALSRWYGMQREVREPSAAAIEAAIPAGGETDQLAIAEATRAGVTAATAVGAAVTRESAQRRQMKAEITKAISAGRFGICVGGGVLPNGDPVGDFVEHTYLCHKWHGRTGSSVATQGKPLDKLADELIDIADGKAKKA